jgi:hypothetical protein
MNVKNNKKINTEVLENFKRKKQLILLCCLYFSSKVTCFCKDLKANILMNFFYFPSHDSITFS